jgi:hypothetical protein
MFFDVHRYIPQAWTKFYEFSFADLRAASDVIENIAQISGKQQVFFSFFSFLKFPLTEFLKNAAVDWQTIQGLLENAMYPDFILFLLTS